MAPSNRTQKTKNGKDAAKAEKNIGVENDEDTDQLTLYVNNLFQHYYYNWKESCQNCQKVKAFINHKRNCDLRECHDCKLYDKVVRYHEKTCQLKEVARKRLEANPCQFCKGDGPERVASPTITRAIACPSNQNDEIIGEEITKMTEASQKGKKFIEGQDYRLGNVIASGGFGMVYDVELLPAGKEKLGIDRSVHLAAKVANVTRNEVHVLKRLAHNEVPYVATHYFIVNKRQVKEWQNRKTGETERKVFTHIIFMKRAEMSLKDLRSRFPDRVLPRDEACYYFRQIVECVRRSHDVYIVHHDIKTSNILMMRDGDGYCAYLADYEFAFDMSNILSDARRGGTKLFEPPEVVDGPADDVHSLGMLFLEMTIPGALDHGKGCCPWPEYKNKKVEELKKKDAGLGHLIGACVKTNWQERPNILQVESKFKEYAGDQRNVLERP